MSIGRRGEGLEPVNDYRLVLEVSCRLTTYSGHDVTWCGKGTSDLGDLRETIDLASEAFKPRREIATYLLEHEDEFMERLAAGTSWHPFEVGGYRCSLDGGRQDGAVLSWTNEGSGSDGSLVARTPHVLANPFTVKGYAEVINLSNVPITIRTKDWIEVHVTPPWDDLHVEFNLEPRRGS